MNTIQELQQDLAELENFAKSATRGRTKALIENEIATVKALIETVSFDRSFYSLGKDEYPSAGCC
jgi:hypothetical protein